MRIATLLLVLCAAMLTGCAPPDPGYRRETRYVFFYKDVWASGLRHPTLPHITSTTKQDTWLADDGYTFPAKDTLRVAWTPGQRHSAQKNIEAAEKEGDWIADPGYQFKRTGGPNFRFDIAAESRPDIARFLAGTNLSVVWVAGLKHPRVPHVKSDETQDRWVADPGYNFPDPTKLAAQWDPGRRHPNNKMQAWSQEGYWLAAPGYRFVSASNLDGVEVVKLQDGEQRELVWKSGVIHPSCPKVMSTQNEGYWVPALGYSFVSKESLDVKAPDTKTEPSAANFFGSVAVAIFAHAYSIPEKDDGFIASAGRDAAKAIRNKAVVSAIDSLKGGTAVGATIPCDHWHFPREADPILESSAIRN